MKKKIVALCLCVALAVVAIGGATLAYFTDTDEAKNTFTVGNVDIKLDEAQVNEYGEVISNDRVNENSYKLIPGATYTKDPTITVLKGSEPCYVRMKVTLNNASKILAMLEDPDWDAFEDQYGENYLRMMPWLYMLKIDWDESIASYFWDCANGSLYMAAAFNQDKYCVVDEEADTITYIFYYNMFGDDEIVDAADGDVVLPALFEEFSIPTWITGEQLASLKDFRIDVTAEAIQAATFDDSAEAWAAFDAQK